MFGAHIDSKENACSSEHQCSTYVPTRNVSCAKMIEKIRTRFHYTISSYGRKLSLSHAHKTSNCSGHECLESCKSCGCSFFNAGFELRGDIENRETQNLMLKANGNVMSKKLKSALGDLFF